MSKVVRVGQRTYEELEGEDYSEWTLDELLHRRGSRSGRSPKVVPMERIREIARRLTPEAQLDQVIGAAAGMLYLRQVAAGEVEGMKERLAAAQYLVNRQFGAAPVRIELPEPPTPLPPGLVARTVVIEATSEETPIRPEIGYGPDE